MRIAALILGIVGGVLGIVAGIFAMTVGGIGAAFAAEGAGTVTWLGFAAILLGVLGIAGGGVALRYPRASALMQLIAGLGGFIAVSLFWIPAGLCLLAGALLAFLGRRPASPVAAA
ncbi:hypothetical protein NET02_03155 [Thermomicrobiaceae bacterium CFH 74404]|uniref:DUF4064 domain-containing protein n=1 Tax=Thermalbibacter longus TaxID=2951981 RepID=A0AA41WBY0_9BACT|nr:hypothetical protein [Thermalbibacter longus]MCM8748133.1 hypothetical protein [Thermalbibacter longus]